MMKFKLKILTIFFFLAFTIPITADEASYDFSSLSNYLQKEINEIPRYYFFDYIILFSL